MVSDDAPRITIERRLAVGGMAEVFLARRDHGATSEEVVVKRMLPGADDAWRELFRREARALRAVRSEHVVRLVDATEDELVLEYVRGPDLGAVLRHLGRRGRRLPVGAVVAVLGDLLRGLADLHAARDQDGAPLGLVHRDVNPSNVLVDAGAGVSKLTDLGVVRVGAAAGATLAGLKGTLAYMAPEQLAGQTAGPTADLYAVGLVAHELLTGRPLHSGGALHELLAARARLPAPPSASRAHTPPALDAWTLALLAPSPGQRPPSAQAAMEALEAIPIEPDRQALARAATAARGGVAPATRTAGPTASGEAPAPVEAGQRPTPARTPALRWRVAAGLGAGVIAIALVVGLVLGVGRAPTRGGAGAQPTAGAAANAGAGPADDAGAGPAEDAGAGAGPAEDAGADAEAAAIAGADAAAIAGAEAGPAEDAGAGADEAPGTAPDAGPAPDVPPRAGPPRRALRLELRPGSAGPVHVRGGGASGLAPVRTRPLGRAAQVLTLHGGSPTLTALLRVRAARRSARGSARVRVTLGAPAGRYYDVRCGGRALGPTPQTVSLRRSLGCRLEAPNGGVLAFTLRALRP